MRGSETKSEEERKNLRQGLDEAESHLKKAHLSRCSLEGEIQRLKMALGDKETERAVNSYRYLCLLSSFDDRTIDFGISTSSCARLLFYRNHIL